MPATADVTDVIFSAAIYAERRFLRICGGVKSGKLSCSDSEAYGCLWKTKRKTKRKDRLNHVNNNPPDSAFAYGFG
jgi:hypothetical protein